MKTLMLGWGNPDREDDGVAWYVLAQTARMVGITPPASYEEPFVNSDVLDFIFELQLTPELAVDIGHYDRVILVDAHTGEKKENVAFQIVEPAFQRSPFTHHLTAETLMELVGQVYHKNIPAALISVRGRSFNFHQGLTAEAAADVKLAAQLALDWMHR